MKIKCKKDLKKNDREETEERKSRKEKQKMMESDLNEECAE